MLRGVPVIASDVGGLKEAKLGVPYLCRSIPSRNMNPPWMKTWCPSRRFRSRDIAPWFAALNKLTTDASHWEEIAAQSRAAALHYTRTLTVEPFEKFLLQLLDRPKRPAPSQPQLSSDKRKLLTLRLKSAGLGFQRSIRNRARPMRLRLLFSACRRGRSGLLEMDRALPGQLRWFRFCCQDERRARRKLRSKTCARLIDALTSRDSAICGNAVRVLRPQHGVRHRVRTHAIVAKDWRSAASSLDRFQRAGAAGSD